MLKIHFIKYRINTSISKNIQYKMFTIESELFESFWLISDNNRDVIVMISLIFIITGIVPQWLLQSMAVEP